MVLIEGGEICNLEARNDPYNVQYSITTCYIYVDWHHFRRRKYSHWDNLQPSFQQNPDKEVCISDKRRTNLHG